MPELEAEELAGAEPVAAPSGSRPLSGGYLLGQSPHMLDGQWRDLLPWHRGQLRLGRRSVRDHAVRDGRPEDGVDRVEDRPRGADGQPGVRRSDGVTQLCTSLGLMAPSARFSQAG